MNIYTQMQQLIQNQYQVAILYSKKPYIRETLITIAAAIVLGVFYFVYSWHQKNQNSKAFQALVEISQSYEQAVQKASQLKDKPANEQTENPWEDVKLLLEALSSKYAHSSLAPFFVMYQVELALKADHDYEKALQLIEKGLRLFSKKSIYFDMFNFKRIKMLLDHPMQDMRALALKELETVANNEENYFAQQALYTIGAYQSGCGDLEKAVDAWKKLAQQTQSENILISSPWVSQAQEKLKTLGIAFA